MEVSSKSLKIYKQDFRFTNFRLCIERKLELIIQIDLKNKSFLKSIPHFILHITAVT